MEINLISKEELKNNLIFISLGNKNITDMVLDGFVRNINKEIERMKLDFEPAIMFVKDKVIIKKLKKDKYTKYNKFEIMDI